MGGSFYFSVAVTCTTVYIFLSSKPNLHFSLPPLSRLKHIHNLPKQTSHQHRSPPSLHVRSRKASNNEITNVITNEITNEISDEITIFRRFIFFGRRFVFGEDFFDYLYFSAPLFIHRQSIGPKNIRCHHQSCCSLASPRVPGRTANEPYHHPHHPSSPPSHGRCRSDTTKSPPKRKTPPPPPPPPKPRPKRRPTIRRKNPLELNK